MCRWLVCLDNQLTIFINPILIYNIDINECDDIHKCEYKCNNTPGSFKCLCPSGYQLKADGTSCEGEIINICIHACMHICTES